MQGPILGILPPVHRSELVGCSLDWPDQDEQAQIISSLGSVLEYLQPTERTDIVIATLNLEAPENRSTAMAGIQPVWGFSPLNWGGLGMGLSHLRPNERTALVRNIGRMGDPHDRAASIGGLAPGFGSLKPEEVSDLVRMIHDTQHEKALGRYACAAISTLGPGLEYVGPDDCAAIRDVIFDADHAHAARDSIERAWAIGGAAPGLLKKLKSSERAAFFATMMDALHDDPTNEALFTGEVIAGWCSNLECFELHERSQILKMISDPRDANFLSDNEDRAKAISGIGRGLQHVPKGVRREILAMICNPAHPQALRNPTEAIAGIGAGLGELDPGERSMMVDAALARQGRERAIAIAGLGQGLEHLDANDRSRLLVAARELSETPFLVDERDDRSLAMYGLGMGAQDWARNLVASRNRTQQGERRTSNSRMLDDRPRLAHSL